jgi:hypothetical protein
MSKILNRFTNKVIAEDSSLTIQELAINNRADLRDANLRGADLRCADLYSADLCGADLCDANLCGANLRGADLRGANLRDANLRDANLRDADLCDADLCDADLRCADLRGVDLEHLKIWLNPCKRDILFVLANVPRSEVEGLREKIIEGKINGSQYEGDCCCLIGSLGNENAISSIPYYDKGTHNMGEQLFLQIREGNTPDTNQFSKVALELCDEYLNNNPKS